MKNLNQIGIDSQKSFIKYNKEEVKLSKDFKLLFTEIIQIKSKESVSFSDFTTIIKTSNGLTITFPNQWFYIASFFVNYLKALKEYKEIYNALFNSVSKDILADIKKTKQIPSEINYKINKYFNTKDDIEYFTKFLSDYDWWYGSKTIDRGDYYVSPILSLAKVVNVSQAYIAHLTHLLSENRQLLDYLNQSELRNEAPKGINDDNILNLKDEFIKWFIEHEGVTHNYLKNNFSNSTTKLKSDLLNYENIYRNEFGSNVFTLDLKNKDNFIELLEDNLNKNKGDFFDFSKKTSTHMPRAIFGKKNYIKFLKDLNYTESLGEEYDFKLLSFQKACKDAGLNYKSELITRYIASLATKPFILLSGLSGSGKTKLAQAFAQWIAEDKTQYCIVPVGADWTNREPLLGYVNALNDDEYILPENGALKLLIEANKEENKNKPYFLILDEMNLSHVERYFADFLSVMESKDILKLHSSENNKSNVPSQLDWPSNLFIVGTVNIDETTYMFSPKVLDRANVIEFRVNKEDIEDFLNSPKEIDFTNLNNGGASMGQSFIEMASNKDFSSTDTTKLNEKLILFFEELKKTGAEFGYRSATEIHRLYNQLTTLDSNMQEADKIDIAIMQKLLPKLHGSRRKLCPILEILASLCVKEKTDVSKGFLNNNETLVYKENENVLYPLSLEKITKMYKGAIDNGFASYAEA
ncbi:McrB family protein [Formosa sp. 3Alg 14/1]|uniref:McrB family protein n=1 Tax=Formosa sp. 3Alg 14/1 TaxID=3382190 RepID=UPI0039BEAFC7